MRSICDAGTIDKTSAPWGLLRGWRSTQAKLA
jgi:hypothetical protein